MPKRKITQQFIDWVDYRLPIFTFIKHEATEYPTPKNLNYWWNFGSLSLFALMLMIVSGIWLAMLYTPHVDYAFNSIERIMRDVNGGWFIRYFHVNGASMFFIAVYIHMVRGLYYGSYKEPRELLWILGVVIFVLMMGTAFFGYVLPWGQMSFWGATVITNLFSAIPYVGDSIVELLWGGFSVSNPTLNRFFALHFLLPFLIVAVMGLHIIALHQHGSNNPVGIELKKSETIPFHPYYTTKDIFGIAVFMFIWMFFVFFAPNFFGEPDNYIPANPLVTPAHIVPEWYFLPFYAILRSVPDKLGGVVLMFGAVLILFVVPWLDTSRVRAATFRPIYKVLFWLFIVCCFALGWAGGENPEGLPLHVSRVATFYYFLFFFLMPVISKIEKTLPVPNSLTKSTVNLSNTVKSLIVFVILTFSCNISAKANNSVEPLKQTWGFQGIMGKFNKDALQRGFQVYREVCSTCHSMNLINFRNLSGIGYSDDVIKAFAAEYEVTDGPDDEGEMFLREAKPFDAMPSPFPNENAARAANNGAYPVDLSLITLARHNGPDYLFSLLNGYEEAPEGFDLYPNMMYNKYFVGNQILMPQPLSDDIVEYHDGTEATLDQMARDITEFLFWAANPHMEERKEVGRNVLIFLIIMSVLMFFVNKRIWSRIK
jgi:ubiquinol-cytochrome c reductase cytochrome b/c1 subunit